MSTQIVNFGSVRAILTSGNPVRQIRCGKDDKTFCFEMHSALGPMLVDAKGNGLKRERTYVMEAITKWAQQGQRMDANNYCIYEV